ncbi:hypothetical protein Ancab_022413 [Ancistrocladus abbreviatus]
MEKSLLRSSKVKSLWESEKFKDWPSDYPWPPRNYTCSFCRREFKSAQALGGHMNVHRRDRARMRDQSPPTSSWVNNIDHSSNTDPNPSPNPNPNPNFSPSSSNVYTHQYSLVTLSLSSYSSAYQASRKEKEKGPLVVAGMHGCHDPLRGFSRVSGHGDEMEILKAKQVIQLDLELSLNGERKEELDLELRLGT